MEGSFEENLLRYTKVKTLSIAFPSSIFANTPSPQLEAYLVGQIARAAVIFNAVEVIIFGEPEENGAEQERLQRLVKLFEYAECPQYLRKRLFAIEPDLKYAGMIHPLESQHHLRTSQIECPYREGVTIKYVDLESKGQMEEFTEVNIGLNQSVYVPGKKQLHSRITVQVDPGDLKKMQALLGQGTKQRTFAEMVPTITPIEKLNLYWGYYVRRADSLSQVLSTNTFAPDKKKFYDLIIGTSEKGVSIDDVKFVSKLTKSSDGQVTFSKKQKLDCQHVLVVFGGVKGLEYSASCDPKLKDCQDVGALFDHYLNTCPKQGSTTIRTEEAIYISLSALRPKLNQF